MSVSSSSSSSGNGNGGVGVVAQQTVSLMNAQHFCSHPTRRPGRSGHVDLSLGLLCPRLRSAMLRSVCPSVCLSVPFPHCSSALSLVTPGVPPTTDPREDLTHGRINDDDAFRRRVRCGPSARHIFSPSWGRYLIYDADVPYIHRSACGSHVGRTVS